MTSVSRGKSKWGHLLPVSERSGLRWLKRMEEVQKGLENSLWTKGFPSSPDGPLKIRYHKFIVEPSGGSFTFSSIGKGIITRTEKTYGLICPTLGIGRTAAEDCQFEMSYRILGYSWERRKEKKWVTVVSRPGREERNQLKPKADLITGGEQGAESLGTEQSSWGPRTGLARVRSQMAGGLGVTLRVVSFSIWEPGGKKRKRKCSGDNMMWCVASYIRFPEWNKAKGHASGKSRGRKV